MIEQPPTQDLCAFCEKVINEEEGFWMHADCWLSLQIWTWPHEPPSSGSHEVVADHAR
jgi:hypothetical protein